MGLGPQAYRPGGRIPAGSDPESGLLSGAPPLPGNGVISGDPSGTGRGTPAWGNAVADGRVDRAPASPDRPAPTATGPAGRGTAPGQGGMPFMGGGGAGRASEQEHRRPSWLVQEDPDAFWFSGLPAHSDPVITPDVDG